MHVDLYNSNINIPNNRISKNKNQNVSMKGKNTKKSRELPEEIIPEFLLQKVLQFSGTCGKLEMKRDLAGKNGHHGRCTMMQRQTFLLLILRYMQVLNNSNLLKE